MVLDTQQIVVRGEDSQTVLCKQKHRDRHQSEPPQKLHLRVVPHRDRQEQDKQEAVKDVRLNGSHQEEDYHGHLGRMNGGEVQALLQGPLDAHVAHLEKAIKSTPQSLIFLLLLLLFRSGDIVRIFATLGFVTRIFLKVIVLRS